MSEHTVPFSVLLVVTPIGDRLAAAERVAAVLGHDVAWVLSAMQGPEVRLLETPDEREALRITAALRMRQLNVRYVQSQQWQTALRSAVERGIQLSDMVTYSASALHSDAAVTRPERVARPSDFARDALIPAEQVSPSLHKRAHSAETGEPAERAGAFGPDRRSTDEELVASQQPLGISERGLAPVSGISADDPSPSQGAAVFRHARRTVVTGEATHSNVPSGDSTSQVPVAHSATPLRDRRANPGGLQELNASPLSAIPSAGDSVPSVAPAATVDVVYASERAPSMVAPPAVPIVSSSAGQRRTSGGARTIDFEFEASREAGPEFSRREDGEDEEQTAGTSAYSDSTSGNFGSFEDELASVSALYDSGGGQGQSSQAAVVTKRTTGTSNPAPARAMTRKETPPSAGKSGAGWLSLVSVIVLLALGVGGTAMWMNEQRSNVVAQFATAGFYAEFAELDRRYGCGRIEDGSQLCRANDAWYAFHFPGLGPNDAQLASDTCYFRCTDTGTIFTTQLQCTLPGPAGGEPPLYLHQSQRRECVPALTSLRDDQASTCLWNAESSMRRGREARPAPTASDETWQVRFLAERESFPTLGGAVSARDYQVTPSAGPAFVWSWSPDVAATVRETLVGGLPRMQLSGRIWPTGRLGDLTLR